MEDELVGDIEDSAPPLHPTPSCRTWLLLTDVLNDAVNSLLQALHCRVPRSVVKTDWLPALAKSLLIPRHDFAKCQKCV